MIDKFMSGFLNRVYDIEDYTQLEINSKLIQKMEEVIENCNNAFEYVDWLKEHGVSDEVQNILFTWKEDGTVKKLLGNLIEELKEEIVLTAPPESPVDVRNVNTVILKSSSAKTIYSFKARDFQEFTVIALNNKISLNSNESDGLMVVKDGIVDPIPVGGVMKFICYKGVCYEISRSF